MTPPTRRFLRAKVRALRARARRLARLTPNTVGIRREDRPFAPGTEHFRAANRRLAQIDREVQGALGRLRLASSAGSPEAILRQSALVERQVDRARRTFALYFDLFAQRGTAFAPQLAACDAVAADCFAVVRGTFPDLLGGPLLKPLSYLDPGFSPATFRRGVMLRRLLGERNPFPLIRVPHERIGSPWGMGVVLHEVGHSLQADLGVWQETEAAVRARVLRLTRDPFTARIWSRWHKEIFADLVAVLLGGPSAASGMKDFLAYPASRVLAFRPASVHPVPYLRGFILAEMVRRVGFPQHAARLVAIWRELYRPHLHRTRVPARLLESAEIVIPAVVDEVAYQTRRGLAGHTLADVVPFRPADERRIRAAARTIEQGVPADLAPRFVVGAARYAIDAGRVPPEVIAQNVLSRLAPVPPDAASRAA